MHALAWLDEVHEHGNVQIVVVLVGNKADEEEKYVASDGRRQVTSEEAARVAKENGMAYIETSAKTGANVEEVL